MRRGFTLVEILISIVVMTIAFFAVLAVQGTAIGAYTASRDSTESTELARNVIEYLQIEGAQWTSGNLSGVQKSFTGTGLSWRAESSPFDTHPVLPTLAGNAFDEWTSLVNSSVDVRLGKEGGLTGTKYCVFARGGYVEADTTDLNTYDATSALTGSPLFRVQIALVYPGVTGTLPASTDGGYDCSAIDTDDLTPESLEALELEGLRATYFGTVIVRRDFGI